MRIISYFLIFNIFYSINVLHSYVTLVSERQLKFLSILFQSTMMFFSTRFLHAESSPALKYLTIMKLPFESYSFRTSFVAEGRFLKFVLNMITKMPAVNQAIMLLHCCSSICSWFSYFPISRLSHFNSLTQTPYIKLTCPSHR